MGDTQGEKVFQKMEKIRAESSAMTIGNSLSSAGTLMVELLLRTTWHFNHADKPSSAFSRSYCWAQELCGLHDDSHSAGPPYWHCCPSGCR